MLLEFIINKDEYKNSIKSIDFKASNGLEISKRSLKASGKDNYYFRLNCPTKSLNAAKVLSEIRTLLENNFKENNFDYRILTDEASQYFTLELYPLVMEFETKLRKFIHNTFFDISDEAEKKVVAQLKTNLKIDKNEKAFPKSDFLEHATLEQINRLLFSNANLHDALKKYMNDSETKTRQDLIDFISDNRCKTIWEEFFYNDFSDSTLPEDFSKLIECRNDVMHFHYISWEAYNEYKELLKKANADLDKQIKKGIVIENSTDNIDKLTNNMEYKTLLAGLHGMFQIINLTSTENTPNRNLMQINPAVAVELSKLSDMYNVLVPTIPKITPDKK
jgi:hypothetical protein